MKLYVIAGAVLLALTVALCLALSACASAKPASVNITHTEVYHITDAKGQNCVLVINPVPEPESFTCTNA